MKTIVIYKSSYGSTKKYAEWIAQDLSCDIKDAKSVKIKDLAGYDTIIYGGGIYAGGINGIKLISKNEEFFENKNVIIFTCCVSDPQDDESIKPIKECLVRDIPQKILAKAKIFHLRGGLDISGMSFMHKTMMKMLKGMIEKKEDKTQQDKEMLANIEKKSDFTDKKYVKPITDYVLSL